MLQAQQAQIFTKENRHVRRWVRMPVPRVASKRAETG